MQVSKGILSSMDAAILKYKKDVGVEGNPFNETLQMTKQEFEDFLNEIEKSERSTDVRVEAKTIDQDGKHKWKDKKSKKFHEDMYGKNKNAYANDLKNGNIEIVYRGYTIEITN